MYNFRKIILLSLRDFYKPEAEEHEKRSADWDNAGVFPVRRGLKGRRMRLRTENRNKIEALIQHDPAKRGIMSGVFID